VIEVHPQQPIFLWGMMGTGKSSVGRVLAERMSRPYIDLDTRIEQRANASVHSIFSDHGEDEFRVLEREILLECGNRTDGPVVALGGGSLLERDQRDWTRNRGPVICLSGTPETLTERIGSADSARPLLQSNDLTSSIERLAATRRIAYGDSDLHIETDDKSIDEVVTSVFKQLKTKVAK
jgi:shikimate kinase